MRHGGQLIATPRQSSRYMNRAGYLCYLCQDRTASPPPLAGECGYCTCGGGRQYIDSPSQLWGRTASLPRWGGGSNSDRDGCLVNTDSALRRESCKFSSFPARTRVPASAGGGQKLLLSHSCPRPCGEMRRVLTLRTQDPALPRYQDYLVFSTLTCTQYSHYEWTSGIEITLHSHLLWTYFWHPPIPLHLKRSKLKNY